MSKTMNKAVGRKWVKALRSGEYEQTTGRLSRTNQHTDSASFCCLGVLCELALEEGVITKSLDPDAASYTYGDSDDGDDMFPTVKVAAWSGMADWVVEDPDADPDFDEPEIGLATLNDDRGLSFTEIADLIESTYELTEEDA